MSIFDIAMLPARQGDSILVTWGREDHAHALLVDAGPIGAYQDITEALVDALPTRRLDLLVMTHIDADHVEGTIRLISDRALGIDVGEIWFNGARHLSDYLAPEHGEILGAIIEHRGLKWNSSFGGHAVRLPDDGPPKSVRMCCDMVLTVLAPTAQSLDVLCSDWRKALKRHNLDFDSEATALTSLEMRQALVPEASYLPVPDDDDGWLGAPALVDVHAVAAGRSGSDHSKPNASSIAIVAELGSQRVMLAGDTTVAALTPGLGRLLNHRKAASLPLDAFKLPHHGSQRNIDSNLVETLPARHYLFSSNGAYFGHPDAEAVATVLKHCPEEATLWFNYRHDKTSVWDDDRLRATHRYNVRYPSKVPGRLRLSLGDAP